MATGSTNHQTLSGIETSNEPFSNDSNLRSINHQTLSGIETGTDRLRPVSRFIAEGDRRHPKQQIVLGPMDTSIDEPAYLDYRVKLPGRSLQEFSRWVYRYQENAQVLTPPELVEKHRLTANQLALRYNPQN